MKKKNYIYTSLDFFFVSKTRSILFPSRKWSVYIRCDDSSHIHRTPLFDWILTFKRSERSTCAPIAPCASERDGMRGFVSLINTIAYMEKFDWSKHKPMEWIQQTLTTHQIQYEFAQEICDTSHTQDICLRFMRSC